MATASPLPEFLRAWERLAGQAYVLADWEGAAERAATLLQQRRARRVVAAALVAPLERALTPRLWGLGIEILDWRARERAVSVVAQADAGLSLPRWAIAETGTLIEVAHDDAERLVSTLPRIHVAFLPASQIIARFETALAHVAAITQPSGRLAVTLISGPSRTGDIELRHVLGVHGPHEVHTLIVTSA